MAKTSLGAVAGLLKIEVVELLCESLLRKQKCERDKTMFKESAHDGVVFKRNRYCLNTPAFVLGCSKVSELEDLILNALKYSIVGGVFSSSISPVDLNSKSIDRR